MFTYIVTGVTVRGRRFRIETQNYAHAMGINLWRGHVWIIERGRRRCIKTVTN